MSDTPTRKLAVELETPLFSDGPSLGSLIAALMAGFTPADLAKAIIEMRLEVPRV